MALQRFDTVLVPLDGSDSGFRALRHAIALAQATGMTLHVLHVFPVGSAALMDMLHYPHIAKARAEGQLKHAQEEEAARIFPVAREMIPAGVAFEEVSRFGNAATEILDYVRSNPGAMIVMGTRGHSELGDLLVGSVTNKVVHHARCPVTVIH